MTATDVSGRLPRDRAAPAAGSPAEVLERTRSSVFGNRGYRPARALAGGLVVIAAIVAALAIYSSRGDRTEVLAVTRTVLAGETLTVSDLQIVAVSGDEVAAVAAADRADVTGAVTRVRLAAGSLIVPGALQPAPFRDGGAATVSIELPAARIPVGLRERSRVVLVAWPQATGSASVEPPAVIAGLVTAIPPDLVQLVTTAGAGSTMVALGVEVPPDSAAVIGAAEVITVGVLDPSAPGPTAAEAPS